MRWCVIILCTAPLLSIGQSWGIKKHPNNGLMAIVKDSVQITDFRYSEVSELSEGKAYVAEGDLYAYINQDGNVLSPFVFVEASNFSGGFALVADSFNRSIINHRMQLVVPLDFFQVRLPVKGLIAVQSHSGLWGLYDTQGDLRSPCVFDLPPLVLSRDRIIVRKNEQYGVINDCNEYVFNCSYQYITDTGFGYRHGKYFRLFE